jgi:hypothetical protein
MASGIIGMSVRPYMSGNTVRIAAGNGAYPGYSLQNGATFRINIPLNKPISPTVTSVKLYGELQVRCGGGTNITATISESSPKICTVTDAGLKVDLSITSTLVNYTPGVAASSGFTIAFT